MSDENDNNNKILDLGKLPRDIPDSPVASLTINVAINGGYSLVIAFEDNLHPITMVFQSKIELLALLNTVMLR